MIPILGKRKINSRLQLERVVSEPLTASTDFVILNIARTKKIKWSSKVNNIPSCNAPCLHQFINQLGSNLVNYYSSSIFQSLAATLLSWCVDLDSIVISTMCVLHIFVSYHIISYHTVLHRLIAPHKHQLGWVQEQTSHPLAIYQIAVHTSTSNLAG